MTPLLVATGGYIPCRDPLKIATSGYIGSCGAVIAPTPERDPGGYDKLHGPDPYLEIALREDEELLMLMRSFLEIKRWL